MPDYEEVRIFHPGTKGEAVVPRTSLATWYRSGWMLVDESQQPAAEAEPAPISAAEVDAAKQQTEAQAPADAKAASKTTSAKSTKE